MILYQLTSEAVASHYQVMTRSPRALIVGCGIAGPVLAILLKNKGYETIVFEKVQKLGDVGASLMLMPNGYA